MAKGVPACPAKEIIDDALADNRRWEWLCYGLVVLLIVTGVSVLIVGMITEAGATTVAGSVVTALFLPAMGFARSFRRDNIRIRLFELPLSLAKTPEEACALLREAIGTVKRAGDTKGAP